MALLQGSSSELSVYLIEHGADLEFIYTEPGKVEESYEFGLGLEIEKEIPIATLPAPGKTALMFAIESDNAIVTLALLSHGANTTIQGYNAQVHAIHYAAMQHSKDVMHALLQHYPQWVDLPDDKQQTPLIWAACHGNFYNLPKICKTVYNKSTPST